MDLASRVLFADDAAPSIDWEEINCLLCGGENWSPLVEAPDHSDHEAGRWFMVVQCRDCGLCFTNPRPSSDTIAQFYRIDYPPHQYTSEGETPRWWQRLPGLRLGADLRHRLPMHGAGRLLDFGCGNGSFLIRMRRQGWNVCGLDTDADIVESLQQDHGISGLVGTLPHPDLPDESFDVITMWQSLEHVHGPMQALRGAYRSLAPGGQLIIATPNIDSCAFRWFGPAWNGLDLPRHLTHFAPWTLRLMLHRAGFRSISIRMVRRSGWLRDSARIAARLHPQPPLNLRLLKGRFAATLASWYARLTGQADCMLATAVKR